MKKSTLATAVGLTIGAASFSAHAALTTTSVLEFNPGVLVCNSTGTYPNCDDPNLGTNVSAGSWFGMDADKNNSISNPEKTPIAMHDGIHIGSASTATGSHSGSPFGAANNYTGTNLIQTGQTTDGKPIYMSDGSGNLVTATTTEAPGVDEPWGFFGNTGMDYLTKAVTVLSDAGTQKWLDFSGWTVTWNGIPAIPMTTGAWSAGTNFFGGGNGVARLNCSSSTCSTTSTFTLDYFATVPLNDPSGFGGVQYKLHLEGHVGEQASPIPVPAAVWLFGSGLVGLAAVARRKKKA
jgi:hypothetical protein